MAGRRRDDQCGLGPGSVDNGVMIDRSPPSRVFRHWDERRRPFLIDSWLDCTAGQRGGIEACFWPEQGGGRECLPGELGVGRPRERLGRKVMAQADRAAGSALLLSYWAGCCVFSGRSLGAPLPRLPGRTPGGVIGRLDGRRGPGRVARGETGGSGRGIDLGCGNKNLRLCCA